MCMKSVRDISANGSKAREKVKESSTGRMAPDMKVDLLMT